MQEQEIIVRQFGNKILCKSCEPRMHEIEPSVASDRKLRCHGCKTLARMETARDYELGLWDEET